MADYIYDFEEGTYRTHIKSLLTTNEQQNKRVNSNYFIFDAPDPKYYKFKTNRNIIVEKRTKTAVNANLIKTETSYGITFKFYDNKLVIITGIPTYSYIYSKINENECEYLYLDVDYNNTTNRLGYIGYDGVYGSDNYGTCFLKDVCINIHNSPNINYIYDDLFCGQYSNEPYRYPSKDPNKPKTLHIDFQTKLKGDVYEIFSYLPYEQITLSNFNIDELTNFSHLFWSDTFTSIIGIENLDIKNQTDMSYLFNYCQNLLYLDFSKWKHTENIINMSYMFYGCSSLTAINGISNFNIENVTNIKGIFYRCSSLTELDLRTWDIQNNNNIGSLGAMFSGCSSLTTLLGYENWVDSKITDIDSMFNDCSSLTTLDLSHWNTINVTSMAYLFAGCSSLNNVSSIISSLNTSKVTTMKGIFKNCSQLTSLNLDHFNTFQVKTFASMFEGCGNLTSLNLSNFTFSTVATRDDVYDNMFKDCSSLQTIIFPSSYAGTRGDKKNISMRGMFQNCTSLLSQPFTNYFGMYCYFMFDGCSSLTTASVNNQPTSDYYWKTIYFGNAFRNCTSLQELRVDLVNGGDGHLEGMCNGAISLKKCYIIGSHRYVSPIYFGSTDIYTNEYTFEGCTSLEELYLYDLDFSSGANTFLNPCTNLKKIVFSGCRKHDHYSSTVVLPKTMYDSNGVGYTQVTSAIIDSHNDNLTLYDTVPTT